MQSRRSATRESIFARKTINLVKLRVWVSTCERYFLRISHGQSRKPDLINPAPDRLQYPAREETPQLSFLFSPPPFFIGGEGHETKPWLGVETDCSSVLLVQFGDWIILV